MNMMEFVNKWLLLFDKPRSRSKIYEYDLEQDLNELGYVYNEELILDPYYDNVNCLEWAIDDIDNIELLASTLIHRWRYYVQDNHRDEIYKPNKRKGLKIILIRFRELAKYKEFDGKITNISIRSKCYCDHALGDEHEVGTEYIEIFDNGEVRFRIFNDNLDLLDSFEDYIDEKIAKDIFDKIKRCFMDKSGRAKMISENAPGFWSLNLEDDKGHSIHFSGEMDSFVYLDDLNLSEYLREKLPFDNLWLFDFECNEDMITSIELNVKHISYFSEEECKEGNVDPVVVFDENFYINRDDQTITHTQGTSKDINVSTVYRLNGVIDEILDGYYDCPFTKIESNSDDYVVNDKLDREYTLTINRLQNNTQVVKGKYYADDLALGLKELIDDLGDSFEYFNISPSLLHEIYNQQRRKKGELVCVGVMIDEEHYDYYLSDNIDIKEGMMVVVPLRYNKTAIAEVDEVLYVAKESLPKPYREIKKIIRVCNEEDLSQLN